jgi:hypothetical protein
VSFTHRLLLAVLVAYRFAHLIGLERGPWDLALRLRTAIIARYGGDNRARTYGRARYQHWIAEGIQCPLCVSFWLSLMAAPLVLLPSAAGDAALVAFGIAGAVLTLHRMAV